MGSAVERAVAQPDRPARRRCVKTDSGAGAGLQRPADLAADAAAFNAAYRQRTDHNLDFTALARYTPDATPAFEAGFARKTRSPNLYQRYPGPPSRWPC
jgi:iron complex outermembrane receptor protein